MVRERRCRGECEYARPHHEGETSAQQRSNAGTGHVAILAARGSEPRATATRHGRGAGAEPVIRLVTVQRSESRPHGDVARRWACTGGRRKRAERGDLPPALKVWIVAGEMISPRGGHTATLLQN